MWTSCCVWWYKFHRSSSKFFLTELEIAIFGQNWQVFQGCHSNRLTHHHEILLAHRAQVTSHFMSISRSSISKSLRVMSQSLTFRCSEADIRYFSLKTYLLLQFSEFSAENEFVWKLMTLRTKLIFRIFDLALRYSALDAQSDHCRPKITFFYNKKVKK